MKTLLRSLAALLLLPAFLLRAQPIPQPLATPPPQMEEAADEIAAPADGQDIPSDVLTNMLPANPAAQPVPAQTPAPTPTVINPSTTPLPVPGLNPAFSPEAMRKAREAAALRRATNQNRFQIPTPGVPVAPGQTVPQPTTQPTAPGPQAGQMVQPTSLEPVAAKGQSLEYDLTFNPAPVDMVLDFYSEVTGKTILRAAQLPLTSTIKVMSQGKLTREETILALEGAFALNGVILIPQGEKFVKAVPSATAIQEGGSLNTLKASDIPDSEQFITQVIQLKHAKPSEVAQTFGQSFSKVQGGLVAIDSSQILVVRDFASNVKRMLELIQKIDVIPETDYKLEIIPVRYGKVADLYDTMSSLISGSGGGGFGRNSATRTPGRTGSSSLSTRNSSRTGSQFNRTGTGLNNQMQPNAAVNPAATTFQNRLNAATRAAGGGDQIELLSDARIVPDERSNTLIVFANKQDIEMITNIVAKVDVLLAQVLIEGIVVAVNLGDKQALGVSWLQSPKRFGDDFSGAGGINNGQGFLGSLTNLANPSGFSYYGKIGDNVTVALTALASDNKARVLQRPRIQTSHAVPGQFFSGTTQPYVTGISDYGGYTSTYSRSTVDYLEVGSMINVTPYITGDGLVVMDIEQELSQVDGYVTIDANQVPTTSKRNASATLSVRDGDTIMFGGYIQETKSDSKSGVPVLKDIPVLGNLFRSKTRDYNRQELMMLLHVTILKTPAEAGNQIQVEKSKLPGLYEAFQEFQKDEEKLRKRAGLDNPTNHTPTLP